MQTVIINKYSLYIKDFVSVYNCQKEVYLFTDQNIARLHLSAPMYFWKNSTPFFGVAAFCMAKVVNFRRQFQN